MKWQEPPIDGRRSAEWDGVAAELRANPGKWALIAEASPSAGTYMTRIRKGLMPDFAPAGAYEAVVRQVSTKPRRHDLYVRFVGGAS